MVRAVPAGAGAAHPWRPFSCPKVLTMFIACSRPARHAASLVGAALAAFVLVSCGSSDFQKVFPVKGKILVDGEPAAECLIYLNRNFDTDHPRPVTPYALTEANGEFQITSYITSDGAPEGEYVITIEWRERSGLLNNNFEGIDRLGGAYANIGTNKAQNGFLVQVGRAPLDLPPFQLTQSAEAKRKHEDWKKRPRMTVGENI
jgi:hypothetical protein